MKQNVYDDPEFFAGYQQLRVSKSGINEAIEQPSLRTVLPPLGCTEVLDLGCGDGEFLRYCLANGALQGTGVDISRNMLQLAVAGSYGLDLTFLHRSLEEVVFPPRSFDVVVSSLALHYVADLQSLISRVFSWLRPGGVFAFSVEHPICTAQKIKQGWVPNAVGTGLAWPVDSYAEEGERQTHWFIDGVLKYHRRISTWVNILIAAGFVIDYLGEPEPTVEALASRPELVQHLERPALLVIRAHAP